MRILKNLRNEENGLFGQTLFNKDNVIYANWKGFKEI